MCLWSTPIGFLAHHFTPTCGPTCAAVRSPLPYECMRNRTFREEGLLIRWTPYGSNRDQKDLHVRTRVDVMFFFCCLLLLHFAFIRTYAFDPTSFLSSYGYLDLPKSHSSSQLSASVMRDAVADFQTTYGLAVTGTINDETRHLMQQPRCGVADKLKSADGGRRRRNLQNLKWDKTTLTYNVGSWPEAGWHQGEVRGVLRQAFDFWSRHVALLFIETADPKADIRVAFGRGTHNCSTPFGGEVLAHGFFPPPPHYDLAGDLHFNNDYSFSREPHTTNVAKPSLLDVAIHEIGHSIGMLHNGMEYNSIMHPHNLAVGAKILTARDLMQLYYKYKLLVPIHGKDGSREASDSGHKGKDGQLPKEPPKPPGRPDLPPIDDGERGEKDTPTSDDVQPNPCRSSVDAMFTVGTEFFVFKADWYWRVRNQTQSIDGPFPIAEMFPQVPTPIDAALYIGHHVVFFHSQTVYVHDLYSSKQRMPVRFPLSQMGITGVEKVLMAFDYHYREREGIKSNIYVWTVGKKGERMYWKLKDRHHLYPAHGRLPVEETYPRSVEESIHWHHVPQEADAAFSFDNEHDIYITSGVLVHKLSTHNASNPVVTGYPIPIGLLWKACQDDYLLNQWKKKRELDTSQGSMRSTVSGIAVIGILMRNFLS